MKAKTLYYCPRDEDMLLFEDVYDERLDFVYQPPHEMPRLCPKCGFILFKENCVVIEELFPSSPSFNPAAAGACSENP